MLVLLHQTEAFRVVTKVKEIIQQERIVADEAKAKAEKEKEQAEVQALHTIKSTCHPCLLAHTSVVPASHRRNRSYVARCKFHRVWCTTPTLSCVKCNWDICPTCLQVEVLPKSQQEAETAKILEDIAQAEREAADRQAKWEEERAAYMADEEKRRAEEKEERRRKLEARFPKQVMKPGPEHRSRERLLKYTVYRSAGYPYGDGFHRGDGPLRKEFDSSFATKKEANLRVEYLSFIENYWGLSEKELRGEYMDMYGCSTEIKDETILGLRKIVMHGGDSEEVTVAAVPSSAFVHMAS